MAYVQLGQAADDNYFRAVLQISGLTHGLDIGCGANLIYCLLGAKICGWKMVGLDISEEAEQGAEENLAENPELLELIEVRISRQSDRSNSKGTSS